MSGYRRCVTAQAADRQRQFESALLELMGQKGLQQIAIQEICDRVGLSRKSFYRYFSSREDCLAALVDHAILDFTQAHLQGDKIYEMMLQFFIHWKTHFQLLDALCRNGLGNLLFERTMLWAAEEYGTQKYFLQSRGDYEQTIFFISGLFGVLLNWHLDNYQKTPAQLADSLTHLLSGYPLGVF